MSAKSYISNSIKLKLAISMVAMLVPLIFLAIGNYIIINRSIDTIPNIIISATEKTDIADLQNLLFQSSIPAHDYLIHGNYRERKTFIQISQQIDSGFQELMDTPLRNHGRKAIMEDTYKLWKKVRDSSQTILAIPNPRKQINDEIYPLIEKMDAYILEAANNLNSIHEIILDEIESESENTRKLGINTPFFSGILLVIAITMAIVISIQLNRKILQPINKLREGAEQFSKGNLDHRITRHSDDELGQLATTFNNLANIMMDNQSRLEEISVTDELTGLCNKRELSHQLGREISRAERTKHSCSVIFMDLDHFKEVNDIHGHSAGDTVLRTISLLIQKGLRPIDIAARYGGEELIVILPETKRRKATLIAERIRKDIEAYDIELSSDHKIRVTASFGVASYPGDGKTQHEVLDKADKAMYLAKRSGRNQVYPVPE